MRYFNFRENQNNSSERSALLDKLIEKEPSQDVFYRKYCLYDENENSLYVEFYEEYFNYSINSYDTISHKWYWKREPDTNTYYWIFNNINTNNKKIECELEILNISPRGFINGEIMWFSSKNMNEYEQISQEQKEKQDECSSCDSFVMNVYPDGDWCYCGYCKSPVYGMQYHGFCYQTMQVEDKFEIKQMKNAGFDPDDPRDIEEYNRLFRYGY